jgi:hypothetical protein
MPQRANVTSVDALESFRANLLVYVSQARSALEEISAEVVRTRLWLENDQRTHWENLLRRRRRDLDEAQQALFSSRISNLRHESALEQMAVHRAKRAVDEAEGKLRILKQWAREYEGRVQPQVKQMEKLHTVLTHDMVQAAAFLCQAIQTLTAYAEIHTPGFGADSSAPAPQSSAGSGEKTEAQ